MAFQKISGLLSPTTDAYQAKLNKLFGNGLDGNIIYAGGVTYLSRDYYFTNLTVNSGATLFTNGFKIFVKETLTNNGTIGMPAGTAQTTSVLGGSVLTRNDGNISYNSANAIGGSITVSQITNFDELISGSRTVGGELQRIYAGAAGAAGAAGTTGDAGNAGTANAGGAAIAPATAGNPGTAGTAGTAGTGGTGGAGGQGGGMVIILAKIVTGSGTFVSEGTVGAAGNPGNPGNPGNAGTQGTAGETSPGVTTPGNPYSHINNPVTVHSKHAERHTATPGNPFSNPNPDIVVNGHAPAVEHHAERHTSHIIPGTHFHYSHHNPGSTGHATHAGAHRGASHIAGSKGFPARHTAAHHVAGNPYSHHTPGRISHAQGANPNTRGHSKSPAIDHHYHAPAQHPQHVAPHTGVNPTTNVKSPETHNSHTEAVPDSTAHNPTAHTATIPAGAAGTANAGNPGAAGNAGATGATGQVGAVVILGQEVTPSVSTSTVIADIG